MQQALAWLGLEFLSDFFTQMHFKRQYLRSIPIACEARDTVPYPEPVMLGILIHISSIFQKVRLEVQFNNNFLILFFHPINNLSVKQIRVFLG